MASVFIGTAGWSIPREAAPRFPKQGSSLERYSSRFRAVEINSSFHRPHRISTWERWRDAVPAEFRFSVKLPKTITHERRLRDFSQPLEEFLHQANTLEEKLAIVLVQLPPRLEYEKAFVDDFFPSLTAGTHAQIVCEPRHSSWFSAEVDHLLATSRIARVAADPALCEAAAVPGGHLGLRYWRLHGSPVIYRSSYGARIKSYGEMIVSQTSGSEIWCIFDNTASSAAVSDAITLARWVEANGSRTKKSPRPGGGST